MDTNPSQQPPSKPPAIAVGFAGDEAEDLGERVVLLTLKQAVELSRYLKQVHGIVPSP